MAWTTLMFSSCETGQQASIVRGGRVSPTAASPGGASSSVVASHSEGRRSNRRRSDQDCHGSPPGEPRKDRWDACPMPLRQLRRLRWRLDGPRGEKGADHRVVADGRRQVDDALVAVALARRRGGRLGYVVVDEE